MISILTTTYNHSDFIAQTIESVLSQSSTDWELLIGDDSPDTKTWDIIEQYQKKYPEKIHAWHHTENLWIVDNLLFLLKKSSQKSKYIAFLEGDDIYTSECLAKKLSVFEKFPNVQLVYSDIDFIDEKWSVFQKKILWSQGIKFYENEIPSIQKYILSPNPLIISYSSVMLRKDILSKVSLRNITAEKSYSVSDYDLFFQISKDYPIFWISQSLTQYRRHKNNLSWNHTKLFQDFYALIDFYEEQHILDTSISYQKKSWIYILLSLSALMRVQKKEAFTYLTASFQICFFSFFAYKLVICILLCLPLWAIALLKKYKKTGF